MTPLTRLTTVTAVILALASGVALGQEAEAPSNTAESLANLAIADLAAWKNKSARKTLQKGRAKYGSTPEYKTAWALLEIQEGANDNQKKVDKGLEVDPRYAPMYFWRAMAWDKIGRKDNMLNDLDQYVKLAPQAPDAGKARALLSAAGR